MVRALAQPNSPFDLRQCCVPFAATREPPDPYKLPLWETIMYSMYSTIVEYCLIPESSDRRKTENRGNSRLGGIMSKKLEVLIIEIEESEHSISNL